MKYFIIALLLVLPILALAAPAGTPGGPSVTPTQSTGGTPCAPGKLCNPLKYENIQQLLPKLLDIVAQVGLIICTFFIIYAGFKYVTAAGDVKAIQTAHSILLWSVIGTAVLLGAKVLASILSNTVNQLIK